ncbi:collagen alpha-1(I) chain-like [Muntiacus reevesi]|uniref:collagen alpha-1(I) chain-like n=1 Tax=Muntiacus reevesi TaxID=9886 RepID=UPI0033077821
MSHSGAGSGQSQCSSSEAEGAQSPRGGPALEKKSGNSGAGWPHPPTEASEQSTGDSRRDTKVSGDQPASPSCPPSEVGGTSWPVLPAPIQGAVLPGLAGQNKERQPPPGPAPPTLWEGLQTGASSAPALWAVTLGLPPGESSLGLPPVASQGALRAAGPRGQEEPAAEAIHPGAQPGDSSRPAHTHASLGKGRPASTAGRQRVQAPLGHEPGSTLRLGAEATIPLLSTFNHDHKGTGLGAGGRVSGAQERCPVLHTSLQTFGLKPKGPRVKPPVPGPHSCTNPDIHRRLTLKPSELTAQAWGPQAGCPRLLQQQGRPCPQRGAPRAISRGLSSDSQDWPMWPLVWTPTAPVILTRVSGPYPQGTGLDPPQSDSSPHPAPEAPWRGIGPLWALGQEPSSPLSVASTPHLRPRAHALCGQRRPETLLPRRETPEQAQAPRIPSWAGVPVNPVGVAGRPLIVTGRFSFLSSTRSGPDTGSPGPASIASLSDLRLIHSAKATLSRLVHGPSPPFPACPRTPVPRPAAYATGSDETGGLGQEGPSHLHACIQHPDSAAFFQLTTFVCPPPLRTLPSWPALSPVRGRRQGGAGVPGPLSPLRPEGSRHHRVEAGPETQAAMGGRAPETGPGRSPASGREGAMTAASVVHAPGTEESHGLGLRSSETCSGTATAGNPHASQSLPPAAGREGAALPLAPGPPPPGDRRLRSPSNPWRTTRSRQQRLPHPEPSLDGITAKLTPRSPLVLWKDSVQVTPPPANCAPTTAQAEPGTRSGPCSGIWASGPANLSFHFAHTDTLSFYSEVLPCGVVYAGRAFSVPVPRGDTREASGAGSN